jgi:hypothetical protein
MANLGQKPRIPSFPLFTVLVDRDDGTEWVLSHNDDRSRCSINDEGLARGSLQPHRDFVRYEVDVDEPRMRRDPQDPPMYLIVRAGRLGYVVDDGDNTHQARALTRKGMQRSFNQISVPNTWTPVWAQRGDLSYSYEEVSE